VYRLFSPKWFLKLIRPLFSISDLPEIKTLCPAFLASSIACHKRMALCLSYGTRVARTVFEQHGVLVASEKTAPASSPFLVIAIRDFRMLP